MTSSQPNLPIEPRALLSEQALTVYVFLPLQKGRSKLYSQL